MTAAAAVKIAGLADKADQLRSLKAEYLQQPRCLICIKDGEEARAYRERAFIEKDLPDECRYCHTRVGQLAVCWTGGLMTLIRRKVYQGLMQAGNAFYGKYFLHDGDVDPGVFKAMCSSVRGLVRYEDHNKDYNLKTGQFEIRYAFTSYEAVEMFLDLLELQKAGMSPDTLCCPRSICLCLCLCLCLSICLCCTPLHCIRRCCTR